MNEIELKYDVLIKIDENNFIIDINSSYFISDATGWIKVDEGYGDKYKHAQGNYMGKSLYDRLGICNYKFINGEIVECTSDDKQPTLDRINIDTEINQLKLNLLNTDYISNKIAEGAASKSDYAEEIAQRASWRARINELENMICLIN